MGLENLRDLKRINLKSFGPDFSAARGSFYFGDSADSLVLQAHLFPDSYTLLWRGNPTPLSTVTSLATSLRNISGEWLGNFPLSQHKLVLSHVVKESPRLPEKPELLEKQTKLVVTAESMKDIATNAEASLGSFWSGTYSFMATIGGETTDIDNNDADKFKLWSEGPKDPYNIEEFGLNAPNNFFPKEAYARLLRDTGFWFQDRRLEEIQAFLKQVKDENQIGINLAN